ncbi:MAG: trypsin-like peptidase domain-containing protein, partial [Clostridia bacterium]|nr:trypsin-like peptidase domain-containing protein [Clostridia bacterium]
MKKFFSRIVAIISVMVLCLSLGGCWLFAEQGTAPDYPDSMTSVDTIVFDTIETGNREKLDRIDAVAQVERSVVAIKMEYTVSGKNASSSGSGVIVNIENAPQNCFYIITCHHVIDSMGLITVYVPDMNCRNFNDADYDERFAFTGVISNQKNNNDEIILVGGDKDYDIAVLMLNLDNVSDVSASEIQAAKVAPQDKNVYKVRRGEDVFSVGNPGGDLPMTVSSGIVSYLDREVAIGGVGYMTLMQIDVQINPGNSGGGLFNLYGELIGITSAGNTEMDGLNYAIPYVMSYDTSENMGFINTAKQLIATYTAFKGENYG